MYVRVCLSLRMSVFPQRMCYMETGMRTSNNTMYVFVLHMYIFPRAILFLRKREQRQRKMPYNLYLSNATIP